MPYSVFERMESRSGLPSRHCFAFLWSKILSTVPCIVWNSLCNLAFHFCSLWHGLFQHRCPSFCRTDLLLPCCSRSWEKNFLARFHQLPVKYSITYLILLVFPTFGFWGKLPIYQRGSPQALNTVECQRQHSQSHHV